VLRHPRSERRGRTGSVEDHSGCDRWPSSLERDLRRIVADAVADVSSSSYREDVRSRKMTFADGEGEVHGAHFVLASWGLADLPA
jgi:hypothetical protein